MIELLNVVKRPNFAVFTPYRGSISVLNLSC